MHRELNTGDSVNNGPSGDWLAGLLLQQGGDFLPRFAYYYRQLAIRPRRWRRLLQRKLAVTVTGAALLLALAGGPVAFAEPIETNSMINVVNGEVAIANNGKCSLMEAIWNARSTNAGNMKADCKAGNTGGSDTVVLPTGGEFVMTEAHNDVYGPTGLPVITSAVVIEGNGATIRRAGESWWEYPEFRILAVDTGGHLTLRNTTITNGNVTSGAGGGGILNYGTLDVVDSVVDSNRTYYYGTQGGGIATFGPTTITNSDISGNTAASGGDGGGGGLFIAPNASATITGSRVVDNNTFGYFGADGAGIWVDGQLTLSNSTISGNWNGGAEGGGLGGGIHVSGEATIIQSTIVNNTASAYYELYSYDWHPGVGGGLSNTGTTQIVNSTISGNRGSYGGGVANILNGELTITQSTIAENIATRIDGDYDSAGGFGGGVFSGETYHGENCSTTTLKGVIVSGNTAMIAGNQIRLDAAGGGYCAPTFQVNAFNVFGQGGASGLSGLSKGATDVVPSVGLNAILSPLADNGGPTRTHALPANSPALDLAPNASCTAAPVNGVDQRGEPRNQNGTGGNSANECDAGSFELGAGGGGGAAGAFLVSPSGSGTVGGVAFAPADILKFDPATGWSMYFDGSDVGITKNLSAFEVQDNGHILMSFAAKQNIPGVGSFLAQDIARFVPTTTGNNTAGSFQWGFDGSAHWLSTSGEKIDALGDIGDGRTALSTTGAAAVKLPNGNVLKAQDEDALGVNLGSGVWSAYFDGTPIPGLKAEDINGLWIDPATGDLYVSIVGAFNLGGVKGNGQDIVKLTSNGGGSYTPSLWYDGSAEGFPSNIDGLDILP